MRWSLSTFVALVSICLNASGAYSRALPSPQDLNSTEVTLSTFAGAAQVSSFVSLGYARYQGLEDTAKGWLRWYNVKYAAPPVGNLRWRAPAAPLNYPGITDATTQDITRCPQGIIPGVMPVEAIQAIPVSEDCLDLTIATPIGTAGNSNLPVVVQFHGGGYTQGSRADLEPAAFEELSDGAFIIVGVNYRLGAFGFLAGAEVAADGDLNVGLLDQQAALQWVQTHISKFGGDPSKVTIWGTSAGAGSVAHHLMANYGATPPPQLFKRAIANSPYSPPQYNYNDSVPTSLYNAFVEQAGCASATNKMSCLRGKPLMPTLRDANILVANTGAYGTFSFVPVTDGSFVTTRFTTGLTPLSTMNGATAIITTHQIRDGFLFTPQNITTTAEGAAFVKALIPSASNTQVNDIFAQYTGFATPLLQTEAVIQELFFQCLSYTLAEGFSQGTSAYTRTGYKGQFALAPGIHTQDNEYYYNANPAGIASQTTFENWTGAFTNFIRSGSPNAPVTRNPSNNVLWTNYISITSPKEKVYSLKADGVTSNTVMTDVDAAAKARCSYLKSIATSTFVM